MRTHVSTALIDPEKMAMPHPRLEVAAQAEGLVDVAYTTVDSPVGKLLLATTPKGPIRVAYAIENHDRVLENLAAQVSPRMLRSAKQLDAAARELDEYFEHERKAFDLQLDLSLSRGLRQLVQRHLPEIGYGQTRSYKEVAEMGRQPEGRPCRGHRLRDQPAPGRRPLLPRAPHRPVPRRLHRRPGGQYHSARFFDDRTTTEKNQSADPWRERVESADWAAVADEIDEYGGALLPKLLTPEETVEFRELYDIEELFRSTINMGRHRFGEGQYRYFHAP